MHVDDPSLVAGGRSDRAARNEHLFRRLNERLHELATFDASSEPLDRYVCECFRTGCAQIVELTMGEYQSIRGTGSHFLTVPDVLHTDPDVETVVERHARYWVVEKTGEAGRTAEALAG